MPDSASQSGLNVCAAAPASSSANWVALGNRAVGSLASVRMIIALMASGTPSSGGGVTLR